MPSKKANKEGAPSWNELLLDLESIMEKYRHALDIILKHTNGDNYSGIVSDKDRFIYNIAKTALDKEPVDKELFNGK
tara:strand:- start:396 stop:626 length:231 start_codon:yes stop_codon:yes gene_type:complete